MSLWNPLTIERVLKEKLINELGEHPGEERFQDYVSARKILLEDVLEEIKSNNPTLSDHGPSHIADVLKKCEQLLGENLTTLTATELYILCTSVLFHDVGNFHDRKKHNIRISEIYDLVRHKDNRFDSERNAVLTIAGAHTGFCKAGSSNTLKPLQIHGVFGVPINFQRIAAFLRFADELAEGPQRTSRVMQHFGKYPADSKIFHKLANVTDYTVDPNNNRILINYNIRIDMTDDGQLLYEQIPLLDLLELLTSRISKVNEERVFCRYYCDWLTAYKEVSVDFKFIHHHEYIDLELDPLILDDLIVPGESSQNACEPNYSANNLVSRVKTALNNKAV